MTITKFNLIKSRQFDESNLNFNLRISSEFTTLVKWRTKSSKRQTGIVNPGKPQGIGTAQPQSQPNSTSTQVGSVYIMGGPPPHPTTPPTHPIKLCVVVVVEPSTLEMFKTSTNTCTIYRGDIK